MSKEKQILLFGYSGHSYVLIELLSRLNLKIKGYFDIEEKILNPYDLKYFGNEKLTNLESLVGDNYVFPSIGNNLLRKKIVEQFLTYSFHQILLTDPLSNISNSVSIGLSSYIGPNVCVNAQSVIGNGVILNTNCVIEHECSVGDYTHIAPSSTLCGNVSIGSNCFIGANTVVRENIHICDDVTIGAGSVVVKSINEPGIYFGNPAKIYSNE